MSDERWGHRPGPARFRRQRLRALPAHRRAAGAAEDRRGAGPPRRAAVPDRPPVLGAVAEVRRPGAGARPPPRSIATSCWRRRGCCARVVLCLRQVTDALDMLDLLDPWDYHVVRTALGHGSGFDSPAFAISPGRPRRWGRPLIARWSGPGPRSPTSIAAGRVRRAAPARRAAHRLRRAAAAVAVSPLQRRRPRHRRGDRSASRGPRSRCWPSSSAQRQLPKMWELRDRLVELFETEAEPPSPPATP